MIYIFLDVDGVLNCDTTPECCDGWLGVEASKIKILKYIVDMTGAEIILTSTWKDGWHHRSKHLNDALANHLDAAMATEGLTITNKTDDQWFNRGEGIQDWLREHPAEAWVVLDDIYFNDFGSEGIEPHLILTDGVYGLTQELAEQAVNMIKEQLHE